MSANAVYDAIVDSFRNQLLNGMQDIYCKAFAPPMIHCLKEMALDVYSDDELEDAVLDMGELFVVHFPQRPSTAARLSRDFRELLRCFWSGKSKNDDARVTPKGISFPPTELECSAGRPEGVALMLAQHVSHIIAQTYCEQRAKTLTADFFDYYDDNVKARLSPRKFATFIKSKGWLTLNVVTVERKAMKIAHMFAETAIIYLSQALAEHKRSDE